MMKTRIPNQYPGSAEGVSEWVRARAGREGSRGEWAKGTEVKARLKWRVTEALSEVSLANWWPGSLDRAGLRQSLRKSAQKSAREEAELLEIT